MYKCFHCILIFIAFSSNKKLKSHFKVFSYYCFYGILNKETNLWAVSSVGRANDS